MPSLKLLAELGLDGKGFAAGFKQAKGLAEGAGEGIKRLVIGAIGIGTVEEAIRRTVETAKDLVETSERLSIAPEQLQVLRQAAKQSHVEFEKLAETFEKVSIARQRALIPGQEGRDARRAFSAMGISTDQLRTQTGAQLLMGPMRQAAVNRNPEELGIIFKELGVKAFGKLIPFLKTDFDALAAELKKVNAIMDTETAVKLSHLSDEFSLMGQILTSLLGPALIDFTELIYSLMLKLGKNLAGAAGFYGAGTAKMNPLQAAGALLKTAGLGAEHLLGIIDTKTLKERLAKTIDMGAAVPAGKKAKEPWEAATAQFEKYLKKMKEEADKLNHPKEADLTGSVLPPKMSKKALETPTDSLIRIGNFLGSNQNMISNLNQRKVQLLQVIANNTKPHVSTRQTPFVGDAEPTFFPIG